MKYAITALVACLLGNSVACGQPAATATPSETQDVLFLLLDRDGDNVLSTAEIKQASMLLRQFDLNSDGTLTLSELRSQRAVKLPAGINDRFLDPDLNPDEWIQRFEIESREVFAGRREIVQAAHLRKGGSIADVGAGTGLFEPLFSEAVGEEGTVYAVDISPKFVDHLRQRVKQAQLKNVHVVHSNTASTELPPASVDTVFICDTYHHFDHYPEMLLSIRQALRPGGQLILIDFERIPGESREFILGHVRAGKSEFRREVERSGFDFVEEVTIPEFKENYFLRFRKRAEAD